MHVFNVTLYICDKVSLLPNPVGPVLRLDS